MSVSESIWVESYRPETLDEIVGHEKIVERMQSFLEDSECPNILFAGPQGVGKTAIVTAFARQKYGDGWRNNVLELNASDDRGIDVVRERIKRFARQGTADGHDFKIIFLDEADQLTKDAQTALRRVMEDYADTTRFFLSCNYLNQIIGPIQSRCAPFRVSGLENEDVKKVLERVTEGEGIEASDEALDMIVQDCRGDARKAINTLQVVTQGDRLLEESLETVIGTVDDEMVKGVVDMAVGGELKEAMETVQIDILKQGIDSRTLADSFLRVIQRHDDLPDDAKVKMIHKLADKEYRTKMGADPLVQWSAFVADINVARHLSLEKYSRAQQK